MAHCHSCRENVRFFIIFFAIGRRAPISCTPLLFLLCLVKKRDGCNKHREQGSKSHQGIGNVEESVVSSLKTDRP